jgi:hypothetical protein
MSLTRRLESVGRGLRLPLTEQRLALEAFGALATARVLLAVLPFPRAIARLGLRLAAASSPCSRGQGHGEGTADSRQIAAVALAIRRASTVAPFRAVCLQQACAAALMLRRRGLSTEVHLGVAPHSGAPLSAHAWSICHGVIVTGARAIPEHTPIAVFTS